MCSATEWPVWTGHSHGRGGHVEVGHLEDLAQLGVDLLLLAAPAGLVEHVDLRHHRVGDAPVERRARSARSRWSVPRSASNASRPLRPAPLTAWYDARSTDARPARSRIGASATTAAAVVQFGFAIRLPRRSRAAWALASGTTSGTSSARRKALELSTTSGTDAPGPAMISRLCAASTARNRTSSSPALSSVRTWTGTDAPRYASVLPSSWPKARRHSAGRPASARIEQNTPPTTPRAPATPTVGHPFMRGPYTTAAAGVLRHAKPMPERDGFPAGVPAWIESRQPDVDAALAFYGALFGWQFDERTLGGGRTSATWLRHAWPADRCGDRLTSHPTCHRVTSVDDRTSPSTSADDAAARVRRAGRSGGRWTRPTASTCAARRCAPIQTAPASACGSRGTIPVPDR